MALKDLKPRVYSTFWDVVNAAQQISTDQVNISEQELWNIVKYKAQLEAVCLQAKSLIRAALEDLYSEDDFRSYPVDEVPFATSPVANIRNVGNTELLAIQVNDSVTPYLTAWQIKMVTPTTFDVVSHLEGAQGSGTVGVEFVSSNGDITIPVEAWISDTAAFVAQDEFWFSLVDVHPLVWSISVWLSTSFALDEIYTNESPNESDFGAKLFNRAKTLLSKLQNPHKEDGYRLYSFGSDDTASLPIIYDVDLFGDDVSPYLDRTQVGETEI